MKYIKSNTCTYNKFKNELDYNYETYNGVLVKTPSEERLEQNEIRAIVCLFDHIQVCPNARFVASNGDIYFSEAKTRSFNSIDKIEKYLDRVREIHLNAEFSFYYAKRDIEPKKYKLRFGIL